MKTSLAGMSLAAIVWFFVCAPGLGQSPAGNQNAAGGTAIATPDEGNAAYYATLNRRLLEANAQLELLTQLAQLHRKRADETPRDQSAKSQWENDLAKELSDQASAAANALDNVSKERTTFEKENPAVAATFLVNSTVGATNGPSVDEIAFLVKLEQRRATVQQDIAAAIETGNLYPTQLLTNKSSNEFSRISSLIQGNGYALKQLERESSDLELRNLEFRALRRR